MQIKTNNKEKISSSAHHSIEAALFLSKMNSIAKNDWQ
jgi:hypothetical protein